MKEAMIVGAVFVGLILFLNLLKAMGGNKSEKRKVKSTKPKSSVKEKTDVQCFNGICNTVAVLEAEMDEFEEKYGNTKLTAKLKRKIRALI